MIPAVESMIFFFRYRKIRCVCEPRFRRASIYIHFPVLCGPSLYQQGKNPTKLPPQFYLRPSFIAFSTSRTNGPRSLSRAKAGTHSAFGEGSHTRAYTPGHGPSLPQPQCGFVLPAELRPTEQLWPRLDAYFIALRWIHQVSVV